MNIKIFGLGWYGLPLAESLLKKGHIISGSVATLGKVSQLSHLNAIQLKYPDVPSKIDSDILILNIPPFAEELDWFKSWHISDRTWIIFISSTSGKLNLQEEWIRSHHQWTILRFGGLYGNDRHPGKHLAGKKNLPGRLWPVNLLHLNDAIGFTELVIDKHLTGEVFNVLSDDHPTREEFYTEYCRTHGLPLPEFDAADTSSKVPTDNSLARKFYSFQRVTYL